MLQRGTHNDHDASFGLWASGLALLVSAARLAFLPSQLPDLDSVNFGSAITHGFDLAAYSPHFPGYPVYVGLSWLVHRAGLSEAAALASVGVVCTGAAAVALSFGLRRAAGPGAGWIGLLMWLVHQFVGSSSLEPTSDATGAAFVAAGVGFALAGITDARGGTRWLVLAGATLGAALGVRPSLAPLVALLVVALVYVSPQRRRAAALLIACGLSVAAWLLPFGALFGDQLWSEGARFILGHFTKWGGGVGASSLGLAERVGTLTWSSVTALAGAWWPDRPLSLLLPSAFVVAGLFASLGLGCNKTVRGRLVWALVAVSVGYLAWVLLAQNVEKPRHLLPLVSLLVTLVSLGWVGLARTSQSRMTVALLAVIALGSWAGEQIGTVRTLASRPSPALQSLEHAERELGSEALYVLGEEARVWTYYAPHLRAHRAASLRQALDELREARVTPPAIYTTLGEGGGGSLEPLATFEVDRYVVPHRSRLVLYRYRAAEQERELADVSMCVR